MALSIFVPIGYITFLVVSLSIFSRIYRKRTAQALVREHGQSWFVEGHPERDIYQTLVQAAADSGQKGDDPNATIPDVVLKAALLNRAMADVRRIIRMRDDKQALGVLVQKGSVGDDLVGKFSLAEKELEAEILDVVSEANTFRPGWGQIIFPSASEMVAHLKHKEAYYAIPEQREEEFKKMTEAGMTIPKPTIEVPALVTPAGTSITIGGPPPGAVPSGPAPPPGMIQQATGINGGVKTVKSGTVADAEDDELQRHFYESIGEVEWDLDGSSSKGSAPHSVLGGGSTLARRNARGPPRGQTLYVADLHAAEDALKTPDANAKRPATGDDGDATTDKTAKQGESQANGEGDAAATAASTAAKKKKHKKKAKKPPPGMFGPAAATASATTVATEEAS